MTIRTACIYAMRKVPAEEWGEYGLRVLVMRKWPRGIRRTDVNVWLPSAAPSNESLDDWHAKKITWENFLQQYRRDQLAQTACHVVTYAGKEHEPAPHDYPHSSLAHLRQLAEKHGTITLLCWEQEEANCHRATLKELLQQSE